MPVHLALLLLAGEGGEKRGHELAIWRARPRRGGASDIILPRAIQLSYVARGRVGLIILIHGVKLPAASRAGDERADYAAVIVIGAHWVIRAGRQAGRVKRLEHIAE